MIKIMFMLMYVFMAIGAAWFNGEIMHELATRLGFSVFMMPIYTGSTIFVVAAMLTGARAFADLMEKVDNV